MLLCGSVSDIFAPDFCTKKALADQGANIVPNISQTVWKLHSRAIFR